MWQIVRTKSVNGVLLYGRLSRELLAFLLALGLFWAPLFAEEARAQEVSAAAPSWETLLTDARSLFSEKRYHKTLQNLFELEKLPLPAEIAAEVHWLYGQSLEAIKLPLLAEGHYRNVVRFGPDAGSVYSQALEAWTLLAVQADDTLELQTRLAHLPEDADPTNGNLEALSYLRGVVHLSEGDLSEALRFLQRVGGATTVLGRQATYLQAVVSLSAADRDTALKLLLPLALSADLPATEVIQRLSRRVREQALLGVARLKFAAGDYAEAQVYYEKVSRDSEYFAQALFEEAWSRFYQGALEEALSNLVVLRLDRAGSREGGAFVPEAELLASQIYLFAGQYDLADAVLRTFLERLTDLRLAMRDLNSVYGEASYALDIMRLAYGLEPSLRVETSSETKESVASDSSSLQRDVARDAVALQSVPRVRPVLEDLRRRRDLSQRLERYDRCHVDHRMLLKQPPWFKETPLFTSLMQETVHEEQTTLWQAGRLVQGQLEQQRLALGELHVLALAYRREVTAQRISDLAETSPLEALPLKPFEFIAPRD